jgi:GTP diphosphokinase / guanosine-3',5'-bis(diphosphate) 3'-diphosphatase
MITLEEVSKQLWMGLVPKIGYLSPSDQEVIELAFTQMVLAHGEMKRKSGEYYIIHPVAACETLAEIKMDGPTLAATLLHDVPEDTTVSLKELSKDFSSEVVFLIEGVTKLSQVRYQGEDRYAENLRRMFVSMSKDLRVIFIKLADRLHNLKTLQFVQPEKQHRIALESLEIYAPIAERLGISFFQNEIEDVVFPYLYKDEYADFVQNSNLAIRKRTQLLNTILEQTKELLTINSIHYEKVYGRAKKYYSIFKKIHSKEKQLDEIYDLVAIRIIVDSVEDCYFTLSVLQAHFHINTSRIKDYISHPKANGYKSLHLTAHNTDEDMSFEFQIRTPQMHEFAEYGMAAHYIYKSKREQRETTQFVTGENLKWINDLVDLGKEDMSPEEYLQNVKLDLFNDRIFVMTPKSDTIDLPLGATCLDFAFQIHGSVGEHAMMAKVNSQIERLSHVLKNGDQVEILTDKRQKPSKDWIQWVRTRYARKYIKAWFRQQERESKL